LVPDVALLRTPTTVGSVPRPASSSDCVRRNTRRTNRGRYTKGRTPLEMLELKR
jgi:hypothetical protein